MAIAVVLLYCYLFNLYGIESMRINHLPKAWTTSPTEAPVIKNVLLPLRIDGKIENFTYKLYQPISGGNEAVIVEKGCYKRESQSDANRLELITGFVDLRNPNYGKIVGNMKDYNDRPDYSDRSETHGVDGGSSNQPTESYARECSCACME